MSGQSQPISNPVTVPVTTVPARKVEYTFKDKGTLIITEECQRQIDYLHKKVGPIEWCGVLFYRKLEGDIDEPKSLKLQAEHIYLMDIGGSTYTEADFDIESICEMDEVIPNVRDLKKGLIHTHHNMTTFFSGTDMSELHDNTGFHNYYLSLIVNFAGVYSAKVAYVAKQVTTIQFKDSNDEERTETSEKDILAMIDLDIVKERQEVIVPDFFRGRYDAVDQKKKEKAAAAAAKYSSGGTGWSGYPSGAGHNSRISQRYPSPGYPSYPGYDDDWEEHWAGTGYPATPNLVVPRGTNSSSKQGVISFTPEGNLNKDGKVFRPLTKVEEEIREAVLDWLATGLSIYPNMVPDKKYDTVSQYLNYFDKYFEGKSSMEGYAWFSGQMQKSMLDMFGSFFPKLVSDVGTDMFDPYTADNPIAIDFFSMFDSYEQYLSEMEKIGEDLEVIDPELAYKL